MLRLRVGRSRRRSRRAPIFQLVEPRLAIAKSVATPRSPVGANDTVTYTLVVTSVGTSPAYDVTITDALPAGVNFGVTKQLTDTNPVTATFGGIDLAWTVSQINVGGVVTVAFTAQVDPAIGPGYILTNTTGATYSGMPGIVPGERSYTTTVVSATISTPLPGAPSKNLNPATARIGEPVVFTVTVPAVAPITSLYDVNLQ